MNVVLLDDAEEEAMGMLQRRQLANELIKDNLTKAQERMRKYANKNRKERTFELGDMVYLKI
jgi:hypothetical protein